MAYDNPLDILGRKLKKPEPIAPSGACYDATQGAARARARVDHAEQPPRHRVQSGADESGVRWRPAAEIGPFSASNPARIKGDDGGL